MRDVFKILIKGEPYPDYGWGAIFEQSQKVTQTVSLLARASQFVPYVNSRVRAPDRTNTRGL